MTPSVKEALVALEEIAIGVVSGWSWRIDRIRGALEAQAAEAECWATLQRGWFDKGHELGLSNLNGEWQASLINDGGYYEDCHGGTRLEALQAAAVWIKKEGSK